MKLKIDHKSPVPLHAQAEKLIRDLIDTEDYKNGKLLPNEVDLSKQLAISRNTLRQAINTLVNEGLLIRKKGYGTKVAKKKVLSGAKNWLSFSQEMRALGIEVCNFELHISRKLPINSVCKLFDISTQTRVLTLERLRGKKDSPFVYFISYFNPSIALSGNEDYNRPLYEILEKDYNVVVKTSREEVSACAADEFLATKLDISIGDPILMRKRFVYDINDYPIEYNVGYYRADSFTYTIECQR